jgi:hypothetical protein
MSKYDPSKGITEDMIKDFKALFPNVTFDRDTISGLGQWEGKDLGPIDIIGNYGGENPSWVWYPKNEAASAGSAVNASGGVPMFLNPQNQNLNVNNPSFGEMIIQQLMAQLNQQRGG